MPHSVRLTRRGLAFESGSPLDGGVRRRVARPKTVIGLLRFWHSWLDGIDEDYTLGDLFSLLRGVRRIEGLSPMLDCEVGEFLAEALQPVLPREESDDGCAIEYLRVGNLVESERWSEKDAATKAPKHHLSREFDAWGHIKGVAGEFEDYDGFIAVDFTPVNELLRYPLRYDATVEFRPVAYGREVAFRTEIPISFGELVHAIFWELGFHGGPGDRNEKRAELMSRIDDIESGTAELVEIDPDDLRRSIALDEDGAAAIDEEAAGEDTTRD